LIVQGKSFKFIKNKRKINSITIALQKYEELAEQPIKPVDLAVDFNAPENSEQVSEKNHC